MNAREFVDYMAALCPALQVWGNEVARQLLEHCGNRLVVPINPRLKSVESALDKLFRKGYVCPETQMTDLVGVRVVVLLRDDLEPTAKFVRSNPAWRVEASRDFEEEIKKHPSIFDYQSHHFEVRPSADCVLNGIAIGQDVCCEVQVRTLLQHAYAEVAHNSTYKANHSPPSRTLRLLARSMALMETTDETLCEALAKVKAANKPLESIAAIADELYSKQIHAVASSSLETALLSEFRECIDNSAVQEFRGFFNGREWIYDRIGERCPDGGSDGLFGRPAVLVTYWLASKLEDELRTQWPFPFLHRDMETVLSDLGI